MNTTLFDRRVSRSRVGLLLSFVLVLMIALVPAVEAAVAVVYPTVYIDDHEIQFLGVEPVADGWRWSYRVKTGRKPAISHINFALCVPHDDLVAVSEEPWEWKDGILKFDKEYADDIPGPDDQELREERTIWFTLASDWPVGEVNVTIKAAGNWPQGMVPGPVCEVVTGKVGDLVWFDINGDGSYQVDEPGLGSVLVELYQDTNGNGVLESSEKIDAQYTDDNGYYLFDGLVVDADGETYWTKVDTATLPFGLTQTYDNHDILDHISKSAPLTSSGPLSDLSLDFGYTYQPEAVELAGSGLRPSKGGVEVWWETGSEIDNLGFNIYRSRSDKPETATKVNGQLIPSKAFGSVVGANYTFLDETAKPGVRYHYWLEDIEASGGFGRADLYLAGLNYVGRGRWSMPETRRAIPAIGGAAAKDSVRFVGVYRDWDADFSKTYLLFNDAPEIEGGILVRYDHQAGTFAIYDDEQDQWLGNVRAHHAASYRARLGVLRGLKTWVKVRKGGKVLRVIWRIRFLKPARGSYNIYQMAEDMAGNATDWELAGTFEIR